MNEKRITVEFFYKNRVYGAYIGSDGGSGVTVQATTPDELGELLAPYMADEAYSIGPDNNE